MSCLFSNCVSPDLEPVELLKIPSSLDGSKPEPMKQKPPDLPVWAKDLYFPRAHLELKGILGKGSYGLVLKAKAQISMGYMVAHQPVAVKTFQVGQEDDELKSEGELMAGMEHHDNIVNILAVSTDLPQYNHRLLLVFRFCSRGSLDKILQNKMEEIRNDPLLEETEDFTMELVVSWACQIAKGMKYLASHSIVHADLAARNILVDEVNTAKVADFGHATRTKDSNTTSKLEGLQPLLWMAPEAIKGHEVNRESDIWSYGVILWEIFSMGERPYPNYTKICSLADDLYDDYRMPKPERCPPDIYNNVILPSWNIHPNERPEWDKSIEILSRMLGGEYLKKYTMIKRQSRETYSIIGEEIPTHQHEEIEEYVSF